MESALRAANENLATLVPNARFFVAKDSGHDIHQDQPELVIEPGAVTIGADRFTAVVEAGSRLRAQSFLIDGEAVVCRDDGVSDFDARGAVATIMTSL